MSDEFTANIPVTFECKKCGGKTIELPDDPTDESIAKCKNCGVELGTWGQIKDAATKTVGEEVTKMFRDTMKKAFEGNEFIKFEG